MSRNSEYNKRYYRHAKLHNLCVSCTRPNNTKYSRCDDCKKKQAEAAQKRRDRLEKLKICTVCAILPNYGPSKLCKECLDQKAFLLRQHRVRKKERNKNATN